MNITSGYLNIRDGASTRSKVIAKAANGARVNIIREAGGTGWVFGSLENGEAGYMSSEYLVEDAPGSGDQDETGGEAPTMTTLRRNDGVYITLAGKMDDCGGLTDDTTKSCWTSCKRLSRRTAR